MTGRARLILAAVLALLVCVLMYFFFVSPKRAELTEVQAQIEAEEIRQTQLRAELARLEDLQENAPALRAELETIRGFVPLKPELSNFIFQVQEAANQAGLDFVEIVPELPETPPEGAALAQVRATIGARGGYFSLQDFVRRLYTLDRALRADTFDLTVLTIDSAGTRLNLTIAARVFYELPEEADSGESTPNTGVPAPTPTPTPTPTP